MASAPETRASATTARIVAKASSSSGASASAKARSAAQSSGTYQYVVVDAPDDVHSTTRGDAEDVKGSPSRREILIRQPSYCKILDDLKGTEANIKGGLEVSTSGGSDSVQTITINGQQYQIVSPEALSAASMAQAVAAAAASGSSSSGSGGSGGSSVIQYTTATSQNGQTVFIPGTVAAGGAQVITVGGGSGVSNGPTEEVSRKREVRLMKNREAARECRNKKKEYIKCLENRVAVLENQNKALIEELKSLKELYTGQKS